MYSVAHSYMCLYVTLYCMCVTVCVLIVLKAIRVSMALLPYLFTT